MTNIQFIWFRTHFLAGIDIYSMNRRVSEGKYGSFEVTWKTTSQNVKKVELIQINVMFVHGI